jgi:RNA polymerase sigma-70 factor (ECF subfamily)
MTETTKNEACAADDAALLGRVRGGDQAACEKLVCRHGGRMLVVARRFLRSEEDSADAVQDAFLAAFRALDTFEGHSSLGTWLHRIVVNTCLMRLRARARHRLVPLDDLLPACDVTELPAPSVRLAREETRALVRACIERLPEAHRTVLLLRDIEELDTDQTAQRLGTTPGAVKTRLHRARLALRTLLEPLILGGQLA